MARRIGRCLTMTALCRQESRHGLPDDLACRDATRCRVSTQTARKAFRHFERDRNRVLGRQRRRTRSRKFEVAIGLPSRQAKRTRQRHGGLRHADLVREQAPRRSQSFGLLHSRRTNHLTRSYYLLRLKSTTHRPRQPTIVRSKRKLSFAFREPSQHYSATFTSPRWTGCWSSRKRPRATASTPTSSTHDWLMGAVEKRLREELAKLQVEINEEKSRNVDLGRGESFGFLGFDFRRVRSRRGVWCAQYTPKLKKRTALLRKLKDVFRRYQSQPLDRVIKLINPMLRGWVAYFAVGNSNECFGFVKDWVEKKIRRHMARARARNRKGFGWKRWNTQWLYESLRLYNGYKVRWLMPKVAPAR